MQNQLQRAMEIAKKTGDRLIVFDNAKSSDPYVVLCLDEYERLAIKRADVRGLTEDELLDKINRDIAVWKSEREFFNEYLKREDYEADYADEAEDDECEDEELEEELYFEPEEYKLYERAREYEAKSALADLSGNMAGGRKENREGREAPRDGLSFAAPFSEPAADESSYASLSREASEECSKATEDEPKKWNIPIDRKKAADEVIGEGRNYLEEIGY
ncbi:MAG: hypothetical protein WCW25_02245 [Patescibacteria group bacterium]|jgi:hypothetical protein